MFTTYSGMKPQLQRLTNLHYDLVIWEKDSVETKK